jgi:polyisoprenoid-binding protein YceI
MSRMGRHVRSLLVVMTAAIAAVPGYALAAEYVIDPAHTSAMFAVKHLMVTTVRGRFGKVQGKMNLDENDITRSSVTAVIDAASIDTDEPKRDEHLRSPDFFDVQKYPTLTFKSTKVQRTKNGLKVTGDLTIRDVTRPVILDVEGPTKPVKDPYGNVKIGASAITRVNRQDFGLKWNAPMEAGGVVVGDDVRITLDLEFLQKKQDTAAVEKK